MRMLFPEPPIGAVMRACFATNGEVSQGPKSFPRAVREKARAGREWQTKPEHWRRMGLSGWRSPPPDWRPCFLRFGHLPPNGRSLDTRTQLPEEGTSVFRGFEVPDGTYYVDVGQNTELLFCFRLFGQRKPVFVVDGEERRPGAAGEAVLYPLRILKTLPEDTTIRLWPELNPFEEETFAIMELGRALVSAVRRESPRRGSLLHGEDHWQKVAVVAEKTLRPGLEPGDRKVAFLFGLFHDSQRHTDGHDPHHGWRAAKLARDLIAKKTPGLVSAEQLAHLEFACAKHADGGLTDDPLVGGLWDADRLLLSRCGIRPDPKRLSLKESRGLIGWAGRLEDREFAWWEIFRGYGLNTKRRYKKGRLHRAYKDFEGVLTTYDRGAC